MMTIWLVLYDQSNKALPAVERVPSESAALQYASLQAMRKLNARIRKYEIQTGIQH